jgi:hypothetical protein
VDGRSTVSPERKSSSSKQKGLAHCFWLRNELPVERNTAYNSGFSFVRNITFVQKAPFK